MTNIDELEALAKAATPGPWEASAYGGVHPTGCGGSIVTALTKSGMYDGWAQNAPYIAAANPATILALIAEVQALREDAERYRAIAGCCETVELRTHPNTKEKWLFIAAKEGWRIGEPFVQNTHHIVDQFVPLAKEPK